MAMLDRHAIHDLVHRTAALLDEENLDEWLNLFDENAAYELCAYSPEIRKWMSWWKSDRATLTRQLKEVDQHVRDPASRRRLVGAPRVELNGDRARAVSPFAVYRTTPEGQSSLYMVGRYEDALIKKSGAWLYTLHRAITDTRLLESFTHIPI